MIRRLIILLLIVGCVFADTIIAIGIGLPNTTVRTCLEDMNAQHILALSASNNYNAEAWSLADNFARLLVKVKSQ